MGKPGLKTILFYAWRRWQPYRRAGASLMGMILLDKLFWVFFAFGLKYIIDHIRDSSHHGTTLWVFFSFLVLFPIISAVNIYSDRLMAAMRVNITNDIRCDIFDHLQKLSINFFKNAQLGDLISRFAGDLSVIERAVSERFIHSIICLCAIAIDVALLLYLNWYLTLGAFLLLAAAPILVKKLSRSFTEASYNMQQAGSQIINTVQENIRAQPVVQGFNLNRQMSATFHEKLKAFAIRYIDSFFIQSLVDKSVILTVVYIVILVNAAGLMLVRSGRLSPGDLAAFLVILIAAYKDLLIASNHVVHLFRGIGGLRRIQELLGIRPQIVDQAAAVRLAPFRQEIRLENVSFSYNGKNRQLDRVDLGIPAGHYLAVVGPSGSGKSTLLSLIPRFYDVSDGRIAVDGQDIRHVTMASLRSQIGIVFQETFLFDASILENIRLFDETIPMSEVDAASRAAEVHDFIQSLPEGYHTPVGENGALLSGGERQRVAIARALCRHPKILLLDEITASLDARVAASVEATVESLAKARTVISVTHNIAQASRADRIAVMEGGKLVELGPHDELLAGDGLYARLWRKAGRSELES